MFKNLSGPLLKNSEVIIYFGFYDISKAITPITAEKYTPSYPNRSCTAHNSYLLPKRQFFLDNSTTPYKSAL
jgi:hypothetical protein